MASPREFPFVGGSYQARSPVFDAQESYNLYLELSQSGVGPSRSVAALYGTPGRKRWANLAGGKVRGLRRFNATTAVAVVGPNVYRLDTAGNGTLLGVVADDGLTVSMDNNGTVMALAAGSQSYAVDPVAGTILPMGVASISAGFIDGRLLLNKADTGQFVYTGLYNSILDPLNFETAEGSPDNLRTLLVMHREAWLLGEFTTEVYGPTGNSAVPFARIGNAFMEVGIAAPRSAAKLGNTCYWLAADERNETGMVVRAQGYEPFPVSTPAVDEAIRSYSRVDDAVAYAYQQAGHLFYCLSFPTAQRTWVFDATTNLWHERGYRNNTTGAREQVREQCQMAFAGKVLVGDRQDGRIYELDLDTYTDDGDPIVRRRRCPYVHAGGAEMSFGRLALIMETGVGLAAGQGSNPQAVLRTSDDGARTWSSTERPAPIGKLGEYTRTVSWRRNGSSTARVFEVTITDPIKVAITAATLEAEAT